MIHYGESSVICGKRDNITGMTTRVGDITCPGCLLEVYRATDETDAGYYERDEYEWINSYADAFVLFLHRSNQCTARGVFKTTAGKLYTFTIRRPGHADMRGHRFLATHMHYPTTRDLSVIAQDLYRLEQQFMTDADRHVFERRLNGTRVQEIRDAAADLLVSIDPSI